MLIFRNIQGHTITISTKAGQKFGGIITFISSEGDLRGVSLNYVREISAPGAPFRDPIFVAWTDILSWAFNEGGGSNLGILRIGNTPDTERNSANIPTRTPILPPTNLPPGYRRRRSGAFSFDVPFTALQFAATSNNFSNTHSNTGPFTEQLQQQSTNPTPAPTIHPTPRHSALAATSSVLSGRNSRLRSGSLTLPPANFPPGYRRPRSGAFSSDIPFNTLRSTTASNNLSSTRGSTKSFRASPFLPAPSSNQGGRLSPKNETPGGQPQTPTRSLWVGNLDDSVTIRRLVHVFATYGAIESLRLLPEKV